MRSKNPRWIARLAWLAAAGSIVAATPWAAAEDTPSPAGDEVRQQNPPPAAPGLTATPGLTVFIDPQTGEVTDQPTAEQKAALIEALKTSLNKSSAGLETFELIYGGHGVHLKGRFQSATIARLRPDGSFDIRCVDHPEQAAELLTAAPADASGWEEQ